MKKVIGIIGAMDKEIEFFKLKWEKQLKKENMGNNDYFIVELENLKIIFASSKVGKVFSTMTATTMILKYNIEFLIFTGVAGSLNSKYNILDTVIANKTIQHDIDITMFGHELGYISGSSREIQQSNDLNNIIIDLFKSKKDFELKTGTILTGDQFISDKKKKEYLVKEFQGDLIEMEGAAVAVVCKNFNIPSIILRTISDSYDGSGEIEFLEFLDKSAEKNAKYVDVIVEYFQNQKKK